METQMKKTSAILAATAAAFILSSGVAPATMAAEQQHKRCYRTVHKLPYRIHVACPNMKDMKTEPMKPAPSKPAPQPSPREPQPQPDPGHN